MTCSICQQSGHNRQTCSVVIKYTYDDCGVRCRINPNDESDFQPVETYCLPCGSPTEECDCGEYKCGKWFNEEKGKFQGAPRRSSPRRPRPTTEIVAPIIPKPDCEEEEDDDETVSVVSEDTCECCGRPYDHRNPHRQSEMCDCVQNDDGTLSRPEEEDDGKFECSACGKAEPEGEDWIDCVCPLDGDVVCPSCWKKWEEEEEHQQESIPEMKDCGHFFDCGCGMTVCGECDEDMCDNEACAIYYTYRNDACMCDGCDFCEWKIRIRKSGLKLTPPFIPE
jgi:hypothetical protein